MLFRIIVFCLYFFISSYADTLTSANNSPIKVAVNIDSVSVSKPINLKLEKTEDENEVLHILQYLTPFLTIIVPIFAMLFSYFQSKSQIVAALKTSKDQIDASLETSQKQLDASLKISKQQIHSQVISANRQVWIISLRDAVSELLSELGMVTHHTKNIKPSPTKYQNEPFTGYLKSILVLSNKISLLINPNEEKSKNLILAIKDYVEICFDPFTTKSAHDAKNKVIGITQEILKEEWLRVKNIE